ncbi:hypothetical protein [Butyrivibrio proteoclasticus]|nr:hypothetical protein [Butyrivibrio proteoclasticus]
MERTIHICIIWGTARKYEESIKAVVRSKFTILAEYEVQWDEDKFGFNLTSLYEENFIYDRFQQKIRGTGPFLVLVVEDSQPYFRMQSTRRGMELLNDNAFTVKNKVRSEITHTFNFHTSINYEETRNNFVKLFGISLTDYIEEGIFPAERVYLKRNCTGVDGWKSLSEFFYAINETTKYVVLRNYEKLPDRHRYDPDGDIDILVEKLPVFLCVINPQVYETENAYQFFNWIQIGDQKILIHVKYVGDHYYDKIIETRLLERRIKNNMGIYVPDTELYFWTLLYHGLFHKENYEKYISVLETIAPQIGVLFKPDKEYLCCLLSDYLRNNGCRCKLHLDAGAASLQTQNFRGEHLIDDNFVFYVFKDEISVLIVWEYLIYDNPKLFSRFVQHYDSLFLLEKHVLINANGIYEKYREKAKANEYLWKYVPRGGCVSELKYVHEPGEKPYFSKKFLSDEDSVEIYGLIYKNENKVLWIEGKQLDCVWKKHFFSVKTEERLNMLLKDICEYFEYIFTMFSIDDWTLSGEIWDGKPQNCFLVNGKNYCLFDKEATSEHPITKEFLVKKCLNEVSRQDFLYLDKQEYDFLKNEIFKHFGIEENDFDDVTIKQHSDAVVEILNLTGKYPTVESVIDASFMQDDLMLIERHRLMNYDQTIDLLCNRISSQDGRTKRQDERVLKLEQRIRELEQSVEDKDSYIERQQKYQDEKELELEQRITELDKSVDDCNRIISLQKEYLERIECSVTYRLGYLLLWIPKKIIHMFF